MNIAAPRRERNCTKWRVRESWRVHTMGRGKKKKALNLFHVRLELIMSWSVHLLLHVAPFSRSHTHTHNLFCVWPFFNERVDLHDAIARRWWRQEKSNNALIISHFYLVFYCYIFNLIVHALVCFKWVKFFFSLNYFSIFFNNLIFDPLDTLSHFIEKWCRLVVSTTSAKHTHCCPIVRCW